jgi:uncharacterized protein (TIGR02996 family)
MDDDRFLQAIEAAPDDETAKLVYADWLEERGDIRAEFIRLENQLTHLPHRLGQLEEQIDRMWLRTVSNRRLKKTNGFETADWLWEVMAQAQQDREKLRPLLYAMTEERLEDFCYEFWNAAFELFPSHHNPDRGFGEDDFLEVGYWVVAQGRELYEAVWANPGLMPHPQTVVALHFLPLGLEIFSERFGREAEWLR